MSILGPRKTLGGAAAPGGSLKKTLGWPHLIALGVGAIVGTGIYTLIGVGAERAGPAVILAFVIAGAVCACAALAYAELATLIPAAGSAYTFSYTAMGETIAWIVGWALIIEYSLVCSTVAVGWSGYLVGWIQSAGIDLPTALLAGPHAGGVFNLPAVLVALAVMSLLIAGTRESATLNIVLVVIKMTALTVFIVFALPAFDADNLQPFMPYGFGSTEIDGTKRGVMAAAAIVFFAFYGFDTVATSAEETKNPGRDLKIGIIGSMIACTAIYMIIAFAAVGAMPYLELADSPEPLALVLRSLGQVTASQAIALAAVVALPSVILVFMYGQSRVFFTMARDGLLPQSLAKLSSNGAPVRITILSGLVSATIAGFFPIDELAELANAGTLVAFTSVAACMMILRRRAPDAPRLFRCPQPYLVGSLAILGCLYLFFSLPSTTLVRFAIATVIGLCIYLAYGRRNSRLTAG
ncbi:APC family permease [Sphingomonas sp. IW22]|uniref:APC family permease n=1 Tax=Sphingomonas sp. IW22 TaxID=3242489 RepID=UPI00351F9B9F